ncbi:MAG: hypothetical protein IH999_10435 [Proteobacteria bacterium]|nr:hypothetical protein [Pseudomonadota bacterium]
MRRERRSLAVAEINRVARHLEWPCDCGRPGRLAKYNPAERAALGLTGLVGEENGCPVVRAVKLPYRVDCYNPEMGCNEVRDLDLAGFVCPFGPSPGCVLTHGYGDGHRASHCMAPCAPAGGYFLRCFDAVLARRDLTGGAAGY